jgi:glucokinase
MEKSHILGIDLGGTNLKIALLNRHFKIQDKQVLSTRNFHKKEELIQAIVSAVEEMLNRNSLSKKEILGLGVGLPGPIDTEKGLVHFFPNIPGWKEVSLAKILQVKLKLPVFIDNDANLMALAEFTQGAGRGFHNVVCLTLGTGVGAGIIIEGKLYRGSNFAAGELGHIPLNEEGPKCNCGGTACLETYIGNNRIIGQAKAAFNRDITLEEVSLLAKKSNSQAKKIWYNVATHLGIALSGVINLLNPDAVVIGGGVANAGKILFDKVEEVILKRAMSVQAKHVKIFKAKLGSDAGMIGAAILVKEELTR